MYLNAHFWYDGYGEAGENGCSSAWHCFLTLVSYGPRSSGGIGDMMIRQSYSREGSHRAYYYLRFFYDVISFCVINIIFMNILFGIIIDIISNIIWNLFR